MSGKIENWDESCLPDLSGQVVVITGSNSGIGYECARAVALRGAQVVMAVRTVSKGEEMADEIRKLDPEVQIEVREVDVGSFDSVRQFAADFDYPHINVLINNAGVVGPKERKSVDGIDMTMATNHYGPFLLTGLLLPLLAKVPGSRVVMVSSKAQDASNFDITDPEWDKRQYSQWPIYSDSKRANLYMMQELNRRIGKAGLSSPEVVACHPGATRSPMTQGALGSFMWYLSQPTEMGALPTLRAAFDEEAEANDYYGPASMMGWRGYPIKSEPKGALKNKRDAKLLWMQSEARTAFKYKFDV